MTPRPCTSRTGQANITSPVRPVQTCWGVARPGLPSSESAHSMGARRARGSEGEGGGREGARDRRRRGADDYGQRDFARCPCRSAASLAPRAPGVAVGVGPHHQGLVRGLGRRSEEVIWVDADLGDGGVEAPQREVRLATVALVVVLARLGEAQRRAQDAPLRGRRRPLGVRLRRRRASGQQRRLRRRGRGLEAERRRHPGRGQGGPGRHGRHVAQHVHDVRGRVGNVDGELHDLRRPGVELVVRVPLYNDRLVHVQERLATEEEASGGREGVLGH
mmetsp:Transcript_46806/g.130380  ORF Transcript_46806/g.130380 Transcript_46806/m.130380 type:complete len:276 (-) Transcript_46806:489-1316(-)